jgi:hypothetical protein
MGVHALGSEAPVECRTLIDPDRPWIANSVADLLQRLDHILGPL